MSEEDLAFNTRSLGGSSGRKYKVWEKIFVEKIESIRNGRLILSTESEDYEFGRTKNGFPDAKIRVLDPIFFRKACLGGSLGVADSYSNGDWASEDLVTVFRLFVKNIDCLDGIEGGYAFLFNKLSRLAYKLLNKNTIKGSHRNISLHYDLGNDFYELMLDPTMTYSCGIFESEKTTLQEAQEAKYDAIIDKLELKPEHKVLEIGTGWGGFAVRAAKQCGCRVTTTTISKMQFEYAANRVQSSDLEDRITLLNSDYRHLKDKFDRVVSIEMIEAVGHEYLPKFFGKISDLLEQNGAALIQGITMPDHRYAKYLREVDYVRTRVFPGSCVPSASAMIAASVKATDLRPVSLRDFGYHYSRTLREWRLRFKQNEEKINSLGYDEAFRRAWEYYLCYCEAGFEEGYTGDVHLLLTKPGCKLARGFPR